jgi:23S rRNA (adenine2503-C2)-methyltransferase
VIRPLNTLFEAGAKRSHVAHAARVWLSGRSLSEHADRDRQRFPRAAGACLPAVDEELHGIARVVDRDAAADGSERRLIELRDGRRVESVILPRAALCVSTQVGCAVGCQFCATGLLGLTRNLDTEEILAQVVLAREQTPIRRVVFMGMGEPAHNLENVIEAIHDLGSYGAIGHKDLVFSTVGDPDTFVRLAAGVVRPALALSLHTMDADLRTALLPRAPKTDPAALLDAALNYSDATGYPLQIQWTLLAGVNDSTDEVDALIARLRNRRAVVDFIDYNPTEGFDHKRTSREHTLTLTHQLHAAGVIAKLRSSSGQDARGGCGQLNASCGTSAG